MDWGDVLLPALLVQVAVLSALGISRARNLTLLRLVTLLGALIFGIWFLLQGSARVWDFGIGFTRNFFWEPSRGISLIVLWAALGVMVQKAEWLALGGLLLAHLSNSPWITGLGFSVCWLARLIETKAFPETQLFRPLVAALLFSAASVLPEVPGREVLVGIGAFALAGACDQWRVIARHERLFPLLTVLAGLRFLASIRSSVEFSSATPIGLAVLAAIMAARAFFSRRSLTEALLACASVWILICPPEWSVELSYAFSLLGIFGVLVAELFSRHGSRLLFVVQGIVGSWFLAGGLGSPLAEHWGNASEAFSAEPWKVISLAAAGAGLVWAYLRELEFQKVEKAAVEPSDGWRFGATLVLAIVFVIQSRNFDLATVAWTPTVGLLVLGATAWSTDRRFRGLVSMEAWIHEVLDRTSVRSSISLTRVARWQPDWRMASRFEAILVVVQRVSNRIPERGTDQKKWLVAREYVEEILARGFFAQGATEIVLAFVLAAVLYWSLVIHGVV